MRSGGVELAATTDPSRWAAAARNATQPITPFHSYAFLSLAARMTATTFTPLIVRHGGADVGIAPWLTLARGPVTVVNRMPFPYVGPLVSPAVLSDTITALARRARAARAVVQEYQLPPGADFDPAMALPSRFELSHDQTYVLDTTQSEDVLWKALKRTTRQNLEKAARVGIEVVESPHGQAVMAAVENATIERKDLEVPYPHHFPPSADELNRDGLEGHWLVARSGDDEIASLIVLLFEGRACLWVGGVHPEHRTTQANVAMFWAGIRWAAERGALTLDMVGLPDPGIERFKRQFGGELRDYPVLRRMAPGWRGAQALHRRSVAALQSRRGDLPTSSV
jgi:CelD/BcsL family acetyltransferase involved in cellulose biosynthesis